MNSTAGLPPVPGTLEQFKGARMAGTLLGKNQSACIPMGEKHRLANPGDEDLVIIEVQCGDYLGEDDIERFEDVYGRA